jgi:hypothetical protein
MHQERLIDFPVSTIRIAPVLRKLFIPPRSEMVGQTIRQFSLRKRHAVEPVMLFSQGEEIRGDFQTVGYFPATQ